MPSSEFKSITQEQVDEIVAKAKAEGNHIYFRGYDLSGLAINADTDEDLRLTECKSTGLKVSAPRSNIRLTDCSFDNSEFRGDTLRVADCKSKGSYFGFRSSRLENGLLDNCDIEATGGVTLTFDAGSDLGHGPNINGGSIMGRTLDIGGATVSGTSFRCVSLELGDCFSDGIVVRRLSGEEPHAGVAIRGGAIINADLTEAGGFSAQNAVVRQVQAPVPPVPADTRGESSRVSRVSDCDVHSCNFAGRQFMRLSRSDLFEVDMADTSVGYAESVSFNGGSVARMNVESISSSLFEGTENLDTVKLGETYNIDLRYPTEEGHRILGVLKDHAAAEGAELDDSNITTHEPTSHLDGPQQPSWDEQEKDVASSIERALSSVNRSTSVASYLAAPVRTGPNGVYQVSEKISHDFGVSETMFKRLVALGKSKGLGLVLDRVSMPSKIWTLFSSIELEESIRTYDMSKLPAIMSRHPDQVGMVEAIMKHEANGYRNSGLARAIEQMPKIFSTDAKVKVFENASPQRMMGSLRSILGNTLIPEDILKNKVEKFPGIISDFDEELLKGPNGKILLPLIVHAVFSSDIENDSDDWDSSKGELVNVLKKEGKTELVKPFIDQLIEKGLVNHLSAFAPGELSEGQENALLAKVKEESEAGSYSGNRIAGIAASVLSVPKASALLVEHPAAFDKFRQIQHDEMSPHLSSVITHMLGTVPTSKLPPSLVVVRFGEEHRVFSDKIRDLAVAQGRDDLSNLSSSPIFDEHSVLSVEQQKQVLSGLDFDGWSSSHNNFALAMGDAHAHTELISHLFSSASPAAREMGVHAARRAMSIKPESEPLYRDLLLSDGSAAAALALVSTVGPKRGANLFDERVADSMIKVIEGKRYDSDNMRLYVDNLLEKDHLARTIPTKERNRRIEVAKRVCAAIFDPKNAVHSARYMYRYIYKSAQDMAKDKIISPGTITNWLKGVWKYPIGRAMSDNLFYDFVSYNNEQMPVGAVQYAMDMNPILGEGSMLGKYGTDEQQLKALESSVESGISPIGVLNSMSAKNIRRFYDDATVRKVPWAARMLRRDGVLEHTIQNGAFTATELESIASNTTKAKAARAAKAAMVMSRVDHALLGPTVDGHGRGYGAAQDGTKLRVQLNTNRLRKLRDILQANGGAVHQKKMVELGMPGDWSKFKDNKGNIVADLVQKHIDAQPFHTYNVSHRTWLGTGWDSPHQRTAAGDPDWDRYIGIQRHNDEQQKVFQLNISDEIMDELAKEGLAGKALKMLDISAGIHGDIHPVIRGRTLGWIRWTGKHGTGPGDGVFIDEIQTDPVSDWNSSRESFNNVTDAEGKKILDIMYRGKWGNQIVLDSFLQWSRDQGHAGTKVAVHGLDSKARISLGGYTTRKDPAAVKYKVDEVGDEVRDSSGKYVPELDAEGKPIPDQMKIRGLSGMPPPVHMNETYGKMPAKEFGWTEGKYKQFDVAEPEKGGMSTMNNTHFQGRITNEDIMRKHEELLAKYTHGWKLSDEEFEMVAAILGSVDF